MLRPTKALPAILTATVLSTLLLASSATAAMMPRTTPGRRRTSRSGSSTSSSTGRSSRIPGAFTRVVRPAARIRFGPSRTSWLRPARLPHPHLSRSGIRQRVGLGRASRWRASSTRPTAAGSCASGCAGAPGSVWTWRFGPRAAAQLSTGSRSRPTTARCATSRRRRSTTAAPGSTPTCRPDFTLWHTMTLSWVPGRITVRIDGQDLGGLPQPHPLGADAPDDADEHRHERVQRVNPDSTTPRTRPAPDRLRVGLQVPLSGHAPA